MPRGIPNSRPGSDSLEHIDTSDDGDIGALDWKHLRVTATNRAIEVVPAHEFGADALAYEQAMNDLLTIEIAESNDPNAPTHAFVGCNGEQLWIPRGQKVRIPRMFVEILARSQSMRIKTVQNHDMNRDEAIDTVRKNSADYPVAVHHDPAGARGSKWLARVTRQGC